ncbi:MAG: TonB-dependent receptor, partial [Phenylobacterium sp.]|nr:TonB-dependent receptor [Phenylobacterium sp.]
LSVVGRQTNVFDHKVTGSVWYFDTNISQTIKSGPMGSEVELFANVNNLLNKKPPVIPGNSLVGALYPTYMPLYDVMGRYYTVGVKMKF